MVLRSAAVLPAAGKRGRAVAEVHRQAPGDGTRAHNWVALLPVLLLLLLGWPLCALRCQQVMQDTQGLRPAGMTAHTLGFRIFQTRHARLVPDVSVLSLSAMLSTLSAYTHVLRKYGDTCQLLWLPVCALVCVLHAPPLPSPTECQALVFKP